MATLEELTGEAKPTEAEPEGVKQAEPEKVEPEPEKAEGETPEPEKDGKAEPEKAQEEDTQKAKQEPESPPDEGKVPVAALQDERSKRQALEKKLSELEAKKEPPPSVFDDEEKAFKAREESVLSQVNQTLFSEGEALAIELHDEETVKAAVAWAEQAASESPTIAKSFQGVPLTRVHRKAVELYQQELKRAEMADPDAYRQKVEAEVRAKLEEEAKAKAEGDEKLRESIPTSLVGEPSKGSLKGSSWSGPTPLDNVIGKGG